MIQKLWGDPLINLYQLKSGPCWLSQPEAAKARSQGFTVKEVEPLNHHVQDELSPSKALKRGGKKKQNKITEELSPASDVDEL